MGLISKYIKEAREKLSQKGKDEEVDTVLEKLLLTKGYGEGYTLMMVQDMFGAGIDTTAHSMAFLFYHLARNPEKQEKLRDEILGVAPDKTAAVTSQVINKMPYMKACIKESHRMTPIAQATARELDYDVVISGYQVPKATQVLCLTMISAMDEDNFANSVSYTPERWLKSSDQAPIHPYSHGTFGHGPRMCVGKRFAEQEMWLLLIKIMQNFRIEYDHDDIRANLRLVLIPDQPLRFKFIDI